MVITTGLLGRRSRRRQARLVWRRPGQGPAALNAEVPPSSWRGSTAHQLASVPLVTPSSRATFRRSAAGLEHQLHAPRLKSSSKFR
jgi:hypothetical protein